MKSLLTLTCCLLTVVTLKAQHFQDSLLISEFFYDTTAFTDLTQKTLWGGNPGVVSGFQYGPVRDIRGLTYQAVHLTPAAIAHAGYQPGTMRASQALDFRFPQAVSRERDTLVIEFDAFWEALNSNGWGESGRIVVTLLHDYPEAEIPFGAIDDLSAAAPFGRPAYNLRLRNTDRTGPYQSGAFLLYGGGREIEGEIERTDRYWLPGFSSEAGGGTPGQGPPYPLSPTQKNENFPVASATHWRHYTWVVAPERLSLYVRDAAAPERDNQLVLFMATPRSDQWEGAIVGQLNAAHGTDIDQPPPLYHWFGRIEALRLYFRGAQQTYLANLQVRHIYAPDQTTAVSTPAVRNFQLFPNPASQQVQLVFPEPLPAPAVVEMYNASGQSLQMVRLAKGSTEMKLFTGHLPPGVYLVRVAGAAGGKVNKLVVR